MSGVDMVIEHLMAVPFSTTRPSNSRRVRCSSALSTPNTRSCAAIASLTTVPRHHGLRREVCPQNAPVLRILFSFHQAAAFERGESELNSLRADQQSPGQFGPGQAGFVGELRSTPIWAVLTP